jgi:hypothetical protein
VCSVEVRCGRREERVVERIQAEEDKQVLYRSETRRPRADSVPFATKKESQATDACLPLTMSIFTILALYSIIVVLRSGPRVASWNSSYYSKDISAAQTSLQAIHESMGNETPRSEGDKSKSRYFFCETDFTQTLEPRENCPDGHPSHVLPLSYYPHHSPVIYLA